MTELFANVLTASDGTITTLSAAISTTDGTSISTAGTFPAALRSGTCRIRIDNELLIATVNSSGVVTSVTRGAEGSTAATHAIAAKVRHILTAGGLLSAQSGSGNGRVLKWDADAEAYDHSAWHQDTTEPREFVGPTNPATIGTITGPVFGDRWTPTEAT